MLWCQSALPLRRQKRDMMQIKNLVSWNAQNLNLLELSTILLGFLRKSIGKPKKTDHKYLMKLSQLWEAFWLRRFTHL